MGGAESVVRNTDKRSSRREHRGEFEAAVARFRTDPFEPLVHQPVGEKSSRGVRVCVRKRPFFAHEADQGEFDVVSCLSRRVVVHDARMKPDMIHMLMNHHDFAFHEVFGHDSGNDDVYFGTARDLVVSAAGGGSGTVMMYGQTGSGKTFTMTAIYERASGEIFDLVGSRAVTVSFIELLGDSCCDMLNGGAPCSLATATDGSVHPYPCVEVHVRDAEELRALIDMAGQLRATAATGVHDQSSRSHACCRIYVEGPDAAASSSTEGCLTLVDLAGTEHRIDSSEHNSDRQREGAKINASLSALKECVRATASGSKFLPYRRNRLTQLLRGCFSGPEHPTVIVATVSPSSKDTEHSLNTLRHACIMDGQGDCKAGAATGSAHVTGGAVAQESLGEINVTQIARARSAARRRSGADKGPAPSWGRPPPPHQSKQSNTAKRDSIDRRCIRRLPPRLAAEVRAARAALAEGNPRQRARFQRAAAAAATGAAPGGAEEAEAQAGRGGAPQDGCSQTPCPDAAAGCEASDGPRDLGSPQGSWARSSSPEGRACSPHAAAGSPPSPLWDEEEDAAWQPASAGAPGTPPRPRPPAAAPDDADLDLRQASAGAYLADMDPFASDPEDAPQRRTTTPTCASPGLPRQRHGAARGGVAAGASCASPAEPEARSPPAAADAEPAHAAERARRPSAVLTPRLAFGSTTPRELTYPAGATPTPPTPKAGKRSPTPTGGGGATPTRARRARSPTPAGDARRARSQTPTRGGAATPGRARSPTPTRGSPPRRPRGMTPTGAQGPVAAPAPRPAWEGQAHLRRSTTPRELRPRDGATPAFPAAQQALRSKRASHRSTTPKKPGAAAAARDREADEEAGCGPPRGCPPGSSLPRTPTRGADLPSTSAGCLPRTPRAVESAIAGAAEDPHAHLRHPQPGATPKAAAAAAPKAAGAKAAAKARRAAEEAATRAQEPSPRKADAAAGAAASRSPASQQQPTRWRGFRNAAGSPEEKAAAAPPAGGGASQAAPAGVALGAEEPSIEEIEQLMFTEAVRQIEERERLEAAAAREAGRVPGPGDGPAAGQTPPAEGQQQDLSAEIDLAASTEHPAPRVRRSPPPKRAAPAPDARDGLEDGGRGSTTATPRAPGGSESDREKAHSLFRLFCSRGRGAQEWRKNDLRLINSFIVVEQEQFGPDKRIDWAHPQTALDELERLVLDATPPPGRHRRPSFAATGPAGGAGEAIRLGRRLSAGSSPVGRPPAARPGEPDGPATPSRSARLEGIRGCSRSPRPEGRSITPSRRHPGHAGQLASEERLDRLQQRVSEAEVGVQKWLSELRRETQRDEDGGGAT